MAIKNPENELNSTVENTFVTWSRQKGQGNIKDNDDFKNK